MATYISTLRFTEQGVRSIGETTRRASAFKAAAKKMGVKVLNIYWTLGSHDGLLIYEAPDEQTATAMMLQLGSLGNVQTSTSRAFNSSEMDAILAKMSG